MRRGELPRIQYSFSRVERRMQRLQDKSESFREIYRWRAGIEATVSRLKHQMNLAKLRVRGMPSVSYVARMRALGLNILRASRYI